MEEIKHPVTDITQMRRMVATLLHDFCPQIFDHNEQRKRWPDDKDDIVEHIKNVMGLSANPKNS